jgi:Large polyvalent protein-associated domain 7
VGSRARARPNSVHPEHSHTSPSPVLAHLKPRARKNGDLVYSLADGGVVIDATEHLRIEKVSDEAVALALTLATTRFRGQRLLVDGSADFGLSLARAARHQVTPVEFADAALEQERCAPGTPSPGASADSPTALEDFIAHQNDLRSRDSSLDFLKVWTPSDAGSVVYLGVHRLSEGSPVLLLKRSDTMLVMRVSEPQASQASAWTVGAMVQVEEDGDLRVDRQRGRQR